VNEYTPILLRLSNQTDKAAYSELLGQGAKIYDSLSSQLQDLIRLRNASKKLTDTDVRDLLFNHLNGVSDREYGVWVHYPWKNALVHILDIQEFTEVRTIRNRYKISTKEASELEKRKVGIIGLSVGHSIAMAMALERIAGEIRIADFDTLELSNMNRIRTSLLNLGVSKSIILAREIAELDPFIKVRCFNEGVSDINIEEFLSGHGNLDLLFEECDSVEVKILARQKARQKGIPIIMETSDRGMIDIERYDLNKSYPLLHGLINEETSYEQLKSLKTSKEKLPFILPFAGLENISDRMAASALEIGSSITSWPQLGTEVQVGSGIAAAICRDIFLGKNIPSQRKYFDNSPYSIEPEIPKGNIVSSELITMSTFILPGSSCFEKKNDIDIETISAILTQALVAPSASNLQHWEFLARGSEIFLYFKKTRPPKPSETLNILPLVSIGAILENIRLISTENTLEFLWQEIESEEYELLIELLFVNCQNQKKETELTTQIPIRFTDRTSENCAQISKLELQELSSFKAHISDTINVMYVDDDEIKSSIFRIIGECDKIRLLNEHGHKEFYSQEIKLKPETDKPTGITLSELLLDRSDEVGIALFQRESVRQFLMDQNLGFGLKNISLKYVSNTSVIGLITLTNLENVHLLNAGIAMERIWLKCSFMNISMHPMTSPIPLFAALLDNSSNLLSSYEKECVHTQLMALKNTLGIKENFQPIFLFRLHKSNIRNFTRRRYRIDQKLKQI